MSKFVRCKGNTQVKEGMGKTPKEAYSDYRGNGGVCAAHECSYERVEELSIEIQWVELVSDDIKCGEQDE